MVSIISEFGIPSTPSPESKIQLLDSASLAMESQISEKALMEEGVEGVEVVEVISHPSTPERYPTTGNPFFSKPQIEVSTYASPVKTHDPFRFDFDSDPKLVKTPISSFMDCSISYGENLVSGMGAGLVNLGNTCFLNAILQCFTHTVPFVESLRSFNHPSPCNGDGFCLLCVLRDHIELSLGSSGRTVSPYKLVDNLNYVSSDFRRYDQEDAHEFLQCLLDKLDSRSIDVSSKGIGSQKQEESFVKKIFGGCLKSKLQCCNCGHCSNTFEPLIDLSLEIDDADSLPSALKSFMKVEKIEETKFNCENCKEDVLVEKQFTLEKTPLIAAFHLKRFKHDGSYVEKIDKYVEYPLELDLQPYSTNQENNDVELKYELYAVVVHTGLSPYSGHYFCFVRSSPQTWHQLDDSKVMRVSEEFVLSQEAYILFYARQGTPWFSTLMETQKQFASTSPKSVLDDVEILGETQKQRVVTSPKSVLNEKTLMGTPKQWVAIPSKSVFNNVDICSRCPAETIDVAKSNQVMDDAEKTHTAIPLDKFNEDLEKASETVDARYLTPPRSPSPDIYFKDPTEDSYSLPLDHLKPKYQTPCTKVSKKELNEETKEAIRLTRSMPSSRAMKFRACMAAGSQSESSINKKKRKPVIDVRREKSATGTCRKLNPSIPVV